MKAITFVDSKFESIALAQRDNFQKFGLDHEIKPMPEQSYGIYLWMNLLDATIDAIKQHGRIFRVDSEIRLLKPIPSSWQHGNAVLFFIDPIITQPCYTAINTGHMILDESSIPFLQSLKFLTECIIPPDYDGSKLGFDDENLSNAAIKLSKLEYQRERIDYDRSDTSTASCSRGDWYTEHTIFTHNFLHNWNTIDYQMNEWAFFRNHFMPYASVKVVDAAILGLKKKISNKHYWASLGLDIKDGSCVIDKWTLLPGEGSFMHYDYPSKKFLSHK